MRMTKLAGIEAFQAVVMKYPCIWRCTICLKYVRLHWAGLLMVLVFSTLESLGFFEKLFAALENKGGIKTLGLPEVKSQ